MKYILGVILFFAILITIGYFIPAYNVFRSITSNPNEWQAGISMESTITWAVVIIVGYSYLILLCILNLFGIFFGFRSRKKAFRLLLLPGFLGLLLAILWLVLFILFDVEWPASWQVVAAPFFVPFIAYLYGLYVRKLLIPKKA